MTSLHVVRKLRLTAKETSIASFEVFIGVIYRIDRCSLQGNFVGIIIKAFLIALLVFR